MERLFKEKPAKKPGGGLKDLPQCECCGRPVKINSNDYLLDEILCPSCEATFKNGKVSRFLSDEDEA